MKLKLTNIIKIIMDHYQILQDTGTIFTRSSICLSAPSEVPENETISIKWIVLFY